MILVLGKGSPGLCGILGPLQVSSTLFLGAPGKSQRFLWVFSLLVVSGVGGLGGSSCL